ncbi:MAG: hypothetical protein JSW40_09610 [Candidatus Omnitrophota bacterium]|nr:MAG: hypothetical protein JSW40_09610 [Candidatus Omnitrophota bacterium]
MVVRVLREVKAINDLRKMIHSNLSTYYPELSGRHLTIRHYPFSKKCHTSIIYEFAICHKKDILKNIVVKQRIPNSFYNHDVVEDTRKEFDNLRLLNALSERRFSIPRVLDAVPKAGILITEKVCGKPFAACLKASSHLPLSKSKKVFLEKLFFRIGEWLREFHRAGFGGYYAVIEVDKFMRKAEEIVDKFPSWGLPCSLGKKLLGRMRGNENKAASCTFPVSSKHGDFQPLNILYNASTITVLDVGFKKNQITIKDVCNFITGVTTFDLKSFYSLWDIATVHHFNRCFLHGYFDHKSIPYAAVEVVCILGLLEALSRDYKRNTSFIKRKRIISFYKRKIQTYIQFPLQAER